MSSKFQRDTVVVSEIAPNLVRQRAVSIGFLKLSDIIRCVSIPPAARTGRSLAPLASYVLLLSTDPYPIRKVLPARLLGQSKFFGLPI
jgi:hypothetical protein